MKKTLTTVAATAVLSSSFVSYAAASTHKVESGDSLWTIAREYDTTVSNLKSWNKLQSEVIYPNQVIKVTKSTSSNVPPAPKKTESSTPSGSKTYTVKSGDTLGQIALAHSVSVSELSSWNGINGYLIYPGQVLKVAKSSASSQAETPVPKPSTSKPQDNQTTYTVKSGDTLGKIALDYSVSVNDLSSWNGIKGHLIYPGQVLKVSKGTGQASKPVPSTPAPSEPEAGSNQQSYTVRSGDTLSHISVKFDVTVSELKSWNGLKSDFLQVGQVLNVKASKKPTITPPKKETSEAPTSFNASKLLSEATSHLGTPYVWGGSSAGGFDCSGFIYYVFKEAGAGNVKRLSSEGYYNRSYYVNKPQPGDLVFFENTYKKGISHLGIYVGNNEFIHAGDNGVQITSLDNSYWKSKFDGFKRFYDL